MEKSHTNYSMYLLVAVLFLLFLTMSSMVGAVEIIFYSNPNACDGDGFSFNGIGPRLCCFSHGGSMLFRNMNSCQTSLVYKTGGCRGDVAGSATGNVCFVGGGFNAGYYYQSCKPRSLLDDVAFDTEECEGLAKPTGIVFTEDAKKGTWVLTSSDALGLFSQLKSLQHGEKANWLQSKGATFDTSSLHEEIELISISKK